MNLAWLNGRLTSDPEGGTSSQGVDYATFSVAIERRTGDGKETSYLDCVAFRQTADFVKQYFGKGDGINVVGSISVRDWTDQSGVKRRKYEIIVREVGFPTGGRRKRGDRDRGNGDRREPNREPEPAGAGAGGYEPSW